MGLSLQLSSVSSANYYAYGAIEAHSWAILTGNERILRIETKNRNLLERSLIAKISPEIAKKPLTPLRSLLSTGSQLPE